MTHANTSRLMPALWLILFILLLPLTAKGQDTAARIDDLISQYAEYGLFNGAVLAAEGDNIVYQNGFGEADMVWGISNTPDTRFRVGSLTKQFTAAMILQLMEEGKIELEAPITQYLTDYPADPGDRITIHHLLTHTSGIPSYTSDPEFLDYVRDPVEPLEFVASFSSKPLDFEPGSQWLYNNSGYFILGALIEELTGMSYEDALQERLLDPLSLDNTGYEGTREIIDGMARGYNRGGDGFIEANYLDSSLPYAAGMMYSTVGDLLIWTKSLTAGKPFQQAETFELMLKPFVEDYGYGLAVRPAEIGGEQVRTYSHSGGIFGFVSLLGFFPDEDRVVVVLDNTESNIQPIYWGMVHLMYGQEVEPPSKPLTLSLTPIIEAHGIEAAIARYHELKDEEPDQHDFSEDQLNQLGYQYLGRGEVETAIAIFKLNVEAYPEAFNPYDSLGEAYLEAGEEEKAIVNYAKALELNPGSESAKSALEKLGVELEPELKLPADLLERYVGVYELAPGFSISIVREDSRLFGQATGQPQVELFPSSETEFYLKVVEASISFVVDGDAPASSLVLHQGGRDMPGKRVE